MVLTPVAQELWDQLCFLSDPTTRWLQRQPSRSDEACLIQRNGHVFLSPGAKRVLQTAVCHDSFDFFEWQMDVTTWNDRIAGSRDEVLWVLREAYELAVWLDE